MHESFRVTVALELCTNCALELAITPRTVQECWWQPFPEGHQHEQAQCSMLREVEGLRLAKQRCRSGKLPSSKAIQKSPRHEEGPQAVSIKQADTELATGELVDRNHIMGRPSIECIHFNTAPVLPIGYPRHLVSCRGPL